MVNYQASVLDRTFAALSDATRRSMVASLGQKGAQTASELAEPFAMSLPAALKHIGLLNEAGLVRREKIGRVVRCELIAAPMREVMNWLEHYEKFWNERLDALAQFVEEDDTWPDKKASRSRAASARPLKKSTAPGRKAK